MAYNKTTWKNGDTITAEKLNNMEEGLADALPKSEVPAKLPNPHTLTFTGAVSATYDGSDAVTISIPTGGESGSQQTIVVGTTPIDVDDSSWWVQPGQDTILSTSPTFGSDLAKNFADQSGEIIINDENASGVAYAQDKNKVTLESVTIHGSAILPVYYIWFPTEIGKTYTFFVKTDSGKQSQFVYGNIGPAQSDSDTTGITTSKRYVLVNSGDGFQFESTSLYACFAYCPWADTFPHTNTYFLYEGSWDSIPDGSTVITLTVLSGNIQSLAIFEGSRVYAKPDLTVYKTDDLDPGLTKKTIIFFGDSIMQLCEIPEYLAATYGVDGYNLGVSGATISYRGDTSSDAKNGYDLTNIVEALESGDLSEQISGGFNDHFSMLLALIAKADTLVIEYGTNDFQGNVTLSGTEKTTIEGAYRYCLEKLATLYPRKTIVVLSTLGYTLLGANNGSYSVMDLKRKVADICDEMHVPFVDMMTLSGINDYNKTIFLEDSVHPRTDPGRKRYGDALYHALKSLGIS